MKSMLTPMGKNSVIPSWSIQQDLAAWPNNFYLRDTIMEYVFMYSPGLGIHRIFYGRGGGGHEAHYMP